MLPKLNGKSFLAVNEDDLQQLINNTDFRENEYLDYKDTLPFLHQPKGDKRREDGISEFRSDICSFANSEGGYLILGIKDNKGCAESINGIEIVDGNTDKFELDRRSNLQSISPRCPYLQFRFVPLKNGKFVVIIYVKNDSFAPYVHLINQASYSIYKRNGNGKAVMTYTEVRNMFNLSLNLDKEILEYRKAQIAFFQERVGSAPFCLLHFIPETFLDASYNLNAFALSKFGGAHFDDILHWWGGCSNAIPNVEGLKYVAASVDYQHYEGCIKNNGVVECFCQLKDGDTLSVKSSGVKYFLWQELLSRIHLVYEHYISTMKKYLDERKIFISLSIVNAKGFTVMDEHLENEVDRNLIMTTPVMLNDFNDAQELELTYNRLFLEYALALGIRRNKSVLEILQLTSK